MSLMEYFEVSVCVMAIGDGEGGLEVALGLVVEGDLFGAYF